MLKIRLQGKDERNYEKGILALDVAKDISEGLARSVVGAKIDGKVCDLMTPLTDDCDIEFLKFADKDGKMVFWHTSTHIMAQAVKRLYPNAKLGTGPALDNGFYYDIDLEEKLTVEDLEKIEKEMKNIVSESLDIVRKEVSRNEAIEIMKNRNEDYKIEIINGTGQNTEFATGKVAMYAVGTYVVNEVKNITGPDFEWGFFAYPEVNNGINGSEAMMIGGQSFAITSVCKNKEAAFGFIEKMTRGEYDEKLAKESISLPADSQNPSWPEQLADVKPYFENCTEIMGGAESNPEITPALKENLIKLYSGKITGAEFVENMKKAAGK